MALQKEREAIARFRKVPLEDVKMEDVMDGMNQPSKPPPSNPSDWLEKPFVYHGKGFGLKPMASLLSQLNERLEATEETFIGDDASDDDSK